MMDGRRFFYQTRRDFPRFHFPLERRLSNGRGRQFRVFPSIANHFRPFDETPLALAKPFTTQPPPGCIDSHHSPGLQFHPPDIGSNAVGTASEAFFRHYWTRETPVAPPGYNPVSAQHPVLEPLSSACGDSPSGQTVGDCFEHCHCPSWNPVHACSGSLGRLFCQALSHMYSRRLPNESICILSMIQVLCGLAAVILSGVAVSRLMFLYNMATGLWSGLFMLLTGVLGIFTSRRFTPCTVICLLTCSVLVSLVSSVLACVSVAGLIEDGLSPFGWITTVSAAQDGVAVYPSSRMIGQQMASNGLRLGLTQNSKEVVSGRWFFASSKLTRTHQAVLHILLLIIGLLEVFISLASAAFCCREVCSPASLRIPALSYLHNRGATLISTGAEILLAVSADPTSPPPNLVDRALPAPALHPSARAFMPGTGQRLLILTQASSGIQALTAAQTVAGLFSAPQSGPQTERPTCSQRGPRALLLSLRETLSNRAQHRQKAARLSARLTRLQPDLCNGRIGRQSMSLLYVMSSLSQVQPSVIFPPFPPAYSGQPEEAYKAPHQPEQSRGSRPPAAPSGGPLTNARSLLGAVVSSLVSSAGQIRAAHSQPHRQAPTNPLFSSVSVGGDRVLQPVLLILDDTPVEGTSASFFRISGLFRPRKYPHQSELP